MDHTCALHEAFGRQACAEQSTIQATLSAVTDVTVQQMTSALTSIYRQHSQGYRHSYQRRLQLLDVDMSDIACGPKAALATKGYFANQRNRRGRQLGRVLASHYGEIVTEQVFAGTTSLTNALPTGVGTPGHAVIVTTAVTCGSSGHVPARSA